MGAPPHPWPSAFGFLHPPSGIRWLLPHTLCGSLFPIYVTNGPKKAPRVGARGCRRLQGGKIRPGWVLSTDLGRALGLLPQGTDRQQKAPGMPQIRGLGPPQDALPKKEGAGYPQCAARPSRTHRLGLHRWLHLGVGTPDLPYAFAFLRGGNKAKPLRAARLELSSFPVSSTEKIPLPSCYRGESL